MRHRRFITALGLLFVACGSPPTGESPVSAEQPGSSHMLATQAAPIGQPLVHQTPLATPTAIPATIDQVLATLIPTVEEFPEGMLLGGDTFLSNERLAEESDTPAQEYDALLDAERITGYYRTYDSDLKKKCANYHGLAFAYIRIDIYRDAEFAQAAMKQNLRFIRSAALTSEKPLTTIGDTALLHHKDMFRVKCKASTTETVRREMFNIGIHSRRNNILTSVYLEATKGSLTPVELEDMVIDLASMTDQRLAEQETTIAATLKAAEPIGENGSFASIITIKDDYSSMRNHRPGDRTILTKDTERRYTFFGNVGQTLELQFELIDGSVTVDIFDPNNRNFYSTARSTNQESTTLKTAGIYTIKFQVEATEREVVPLKCQTTTMCFNDYKNAYMEKVFPEATLDIRLK